MTPHVTCVCLTADRQEYTDRAVKNFLAQTYPERSLVIWDTGEKPYCLPRDIDDIVGQPLTDIVVKREKPLMTIGALRNEANEIAIEIESDIIAHWDSDDYSHPLRLAWQVAKLKDSGKDAVGYRTMLFWRKSDQTAWLFQHEKPTYCVGTSLMYWRKAWESNPFQDRQVGEDLMFLHGVKSIADVGFFQTDKFEEPAMVAEVHGGNTTTLDHVMVHNPAENWTRVPGWDDRLRELMKL